MDIHASSVKKCCGLEFTQIFRAILYHPALTWGAKCLAFAILDLPPTTPAKNAALARKIDSHPAQISVWRKELVNHKILEK